MILKTKNPREIRYDFFEYILAFSFVLDARSMWLSADKFIPGAKVLAYILLITGVIGCILSSRVQQESLKKILYISLVVFVFLAFYVLIYPEYFLGYARQVISLYSIFIYLFLKNEHRKNILLKYADIVMIIAVISLVFWILSSILGVLHPTGYVYSYWSKSVVPSYFDLYFTPQMDMNAWGILNVSARNCACFTEAPMSALNFGIALLIEVFINDSVNKRHIVILSLAMMTTFSTLGYLLLIYIMAYLLFKSKSKYVIVKIIKVLIIPVALISLAFVARYITTSRLDTGSGMERTYDFVVGFRTWLSKPLFGYGYGNFDDLKKSSFSLFGIGTGFSNSITPILCGGGLYFAIPVLFIIIKDFRTVMKYRNYNYLFCLLGLIFLYVFIICPYQWIVFALFFFFGDKKSYINPDIKRVSYVTDDI